MKNVFQNLKPKIQSREQRERQGTHSIITKAHLQLFKRTHDLDYLQWMQCNHIRYIGCIGLLALLFAGSVHTMQNPLYESAQVRVVPQIVNHKTDELHVKDAVADIEKQQEEPAITQNNIANKEPENAHDDSLDDVKTQSQIELEEQIMYLNPLHLSHYQAPSSGMLVYNYGFGYDPVYEDYRFHRAICYDTGDGPVLACVDGTISAVQMDQYWQLAVLGQEGTIWYRGMQSCDVGVGDAVTAGQKIGMTNRKIYIQAVKNK